MRSLTKRITIGAIELLCICLLGATISMAQTGQAPKPQMAEEAFKNVTVLKGIPVDEFMDTMGMISAALGLNCLDCHTSDADQAWAKFALDTPIKNTSRKMIQMVPPSTRRTSPEPRASPAGHAIAETCAPARCRT